MQTRSSISASIKMSSSYTPKPRDNAKSVIRLRNCIPEKFFSFCFFHLSIVLNFDGSSFEEILTDEAKPRKIMTPLWRKKETKSFYFGSQLTTDSIASIFHLISYLKQPENIEVEGLFRKTGSSARQTLLKEMLNKSSELNLEEGQFSPHDCASVLKSFLKELPECLMLDKFAKAHCQLCDMSKQASLETNEIQKAKVLRAIQLLVLLLPEENALLLECLLELLSKVVSVEKNRMTSTSLGTIFAPHLLCPKKLTASEFHTASENYAELAAFIIDNADKVFQIPIELVWDIDQFWEDMEDRNKTPSNFCDVSVTKNGLSSRWSMSDEAENTCMTFTCRNQVADENTTQTEMAKLYEHIQGMPDTARKRKLMKKFAQPTPKKADACPQSAKENNFCQRVSHLFKYTGRQTRSRNLSHFSDSLKKFPFFRQNHREMDRLSYGLPSATRQTRLTSTLKKKTAESSMQTAESSMQTVDLGLDAEATPRSVLNKKMDFADTPKNTTPVNTPQIPLITRQPPTPTLKKQPSTPINKSRPPPLIITRPPPSPLDVMMSSPLVHVIELNQSPQPARRPRKRRSSEFSEAIITKSRVDADKTPVSHPPPSIENEINYLPNLTNKKIRIVPVTPVNTTSDEPFYTPATSFRKKQYRTVSHLRRRAFPAGLTSDIESVV